MPAEQVELSGLVVRETVESASKSERGAVVLKTDSGESYILRRKDAPAFGDDGLESLVGGSITTTGIAIDRTLIMQEWRRREP